MKRLKTSVRRHINASSSRTNSCVIPQVFHSLWKRIINEWVLHTNVSLYTIRQMIVTHKTRLSYLVHLLDQSSSIKDSPNISPLISKTKTFIATSTSNALGHACHFFCNYSLIACSNVALSSQIRFVIFYDRPFNSSITSFHCLNNNVVILRYYHKFAMSVIIASFHCLNNDVILLRKYHKFALSAFIESFIDVIV